MEGICVRYSTHNRLVVLALLVVPYGVTQDALVELATLEVSIRLADQESEMGFTADSPVTIHQGSARETFAAGVYRLQRVNATPAITQYRVFGKSFEPGEETLAIEYVNQWRDKGYDTELVTLGRRYRAPSNAVVDTRIYWVCFGRAATESQAEALRKRLEAEPVWAWVRLERVHEGRGVAALVDARGERVGQWELPLVVECDAPLLLKGINTGFWKEKRVDQRYAGRVEVRVDNVGKLEILERAGLDAYLQGVLPAEMPALWPLEALKAQAVAARSEVIFNAAKTHLLEGVDFCALEHCRAYGAESLRAESTDAAIAATRGEVITHGGKVVPTVFSASCGGWTEDNDSVWSGPPHPALRAVPDFAHGGAAPALPAAQGMAGWLATPPAAYCRGDREYFRWERTLTVSELNAAVNKQHRIGAVVNITLGERARSGRLKWVTVQGREDSVTIRKELPIRLAFGGLPSAVFVVDVKRSPEGLRSVTFRGGGRGHGVGLCQHGARGMALEGKDYADILRHYFSGITIERVSPQ